jgi:hypothetical protein
MADNDRQGMYAAVLEDIERKIAELQQTAANIRALMGIQTGEAGATTPGVSESGTVLIPRRELKGGDPLSLVKVGDFYGRSYAEAAREFLRRVGEPQNTLTILSAMRKAAFEMKGKNPASALYTSLKRHKGFLLVHRNTWGLAEWYPGVEKKKPESRPSKKARRPKKKQDKEGLMLEDKRKGE